MVGYKRAVGLAQLVAERFVVRLVLGVEQNGLELALDRIDLRSGSALGFAELGADGFDALKDRWCGHVVATMAQTRGGRGEHRAKCAAGFSYMSTCFQWVRPPSYRQFETICRSRRNEFDL